MGRRHVRIVISTIFQNGGDATRALEIARIIRDAQPVDTDAEIIFLSHGSRFETTALRLGFQVQQVAPPLAGQNFKEDFHTGFGELIGDRALAVELLRGEMAALKALAPDLLIFGFWPIASIARRMVIPDTPALAFLPLPLGEALLGQVSTFPDEVAAAHLPRWLQGLILRLLPARVKRRVPALRHGNIRAAAEQLNWQGAPLENIFDMLRADRVLVNDFPEFYDTSAFDDRFLFTGPLFARLGAQQITDAAILSVLAPDNPRPKLFCSLGSSGDKAALLEIIEVFNQGAGQGWSGVILAPPAICPLEEAQAALANPHVTITDAFVPARAINALADMVICHGGQGTLQTAITSGTPLVGLATQPEQKLNLEHLEAWGMAHRLPRWKWRADIIRRHASMILGDPHYRERARALAQIAREIPGDKMIGASVWAML